MDIQTKKVQVKNHEWQEYTLSNDKGMKVSILDFGGIITEIQAPDQEGNFENVVLAFKNYEDYLENPGFLGALTGRVAGRIENAQFDVEGVTYNLTKNEGNHHLHGGNEGFHNALWNVEPFQKADEVGLTLTYSSPDGHNGYPGKLDMEVVYSLNNKNELSITYEGESDKKTVLTATNHSYFNLSGNLKSDVLEHVITLDSSKFVELDDELIPTGEIIDVEGTTFDFRNGRPIKDGKRSNYKQNLVANHGYDHYFIFDHSKPESITVRDNNSGRELVVSTEQPGFVMYTANNLGEGMALKEGTSKKYLGVCLETQASPASIHHEGFPSVWLDKGERYSKKTTFSFNTFNN